MKTKLLSFLVFLLILSPLANGAYQGQTGIVTNGANLVGVGGQTAPAAVVDAKEPQTFAKCYRSATDYTTNCNSTFGTPFAFLVNSSDIAYFGSTQPFNGITLTLARKSKPTYPVLVVQYWNGTAWTSVGSVTDTTIATGTGMGSLSQNGTLSWAAPSGWVQNSLNSSANLYYIKITTSNNQSYPTYLYSAHPGATATLNLFGAINDTTPFLTATNGKLTVNGSSVTPTRMITVCSQSSKVLVSGQIKQCDFLGDGVQDQIAFQAAISACGTGVCTIAVADGTYNILSSITFTQGTSPSALDFIGMGEAETVFQTPNTTITPIFANSGYSASALMTDYHFRNFSAIKADTKDGTIGKKVISLPYSQNIVVEHVYAQGSAGTCIATDFAINAKLSFNTLYDCGSSGQATGNSGFGIGTNNVSGESYIITNNVITSNSTDTYGGILMEGQSTTYSNGSCVIANNIIKNVNVTGILIKGSPGCVVANNYVTGSGAQGIQIFNYPTGGVVSNTLVTGNILTGNTGYGVLVGTTTGSSNINITNNNLCGNTAGPSSGYATTYNIFGNSCDTSSWIGNSTAQQDLQVYGHYLSSGTAPAVGSCGTGATIVGNDDAFLLTVGTSPSTTCTATFNVAATTNAPICSVEIGATADGTTTTAVTTTTTTLTLTKATAFTAADPIQVICKRWK